jgi:hypothetical protein
MPTPPRYQRRASAADLLFFARPDLWPHRPFLPVTRQAVDCPERQCGLLYDARGVSGTWGYGSTVFLVNLFLLPPTEAAFLALPRCVYDTLDELADDGWTVD